MVRIKMKALVKDQAGPGAVIKRLEMPQLGPHDVLVKVLSTAICGTDLHIYNWDQWAASRIKPPVVMGHEMAGEVVKLGSAVQSCRKGDYVSLECHKTCGQCFQCKTGQAHICRDYSIIGVDLDGCFAEYARVPEGNLWLNEQQMAPEVACLQDPVGNAVLAVLSAEIAGKTVLITGCGAIGLFAVGVAGAAGAARVLAVDINDYRLNIAKRMGAAVVINPIRENVVDLVLQHTQGCGVDVAVEMSGNQECLYDGLKTVKNGGRIALLGIPSGKVSLDLANDVIFKGITVAGITGREIFATWYKTAALLNGALDINPIITHRMKMADYVEAFEIMKSGECGKIILYP
ncbi:MAG: L-threonine 3-dehydrogenase [Bacillota bacterium]